MRKQFRVVSDNASAAVLNAAPNDYTLLVFSGSQHATIAAAGHAPYEPVKGFVPITLLFISVGAVSVPADSPKAPLSDLFEGGKKKSGGLLLGTPGLGSPSRLLGARLALAANVPIQAIHYRGGSASRDPDVQRRLAENGTPIATSTSDEMGKLMAEETIAMDALIKTLGLKLQ